MEKENIPKTDAEKLEIIKRIVGDPYVHQWKADALRMNLLKIRELLGLSVELRSSVVRAKS